MDFKQIFKSLTKLEIILLVVFIIYIIFPVDTPTIFVDYVDSPLGMLTIFIITIYLFFHTNPIIAIIYVLVAYELLRRTSQNKGKVVLKQYNSYTNTTQSYTPDVTNSNDQPTLNPDEITKKTVSFNENANTETFIEDMNTETFIEDETIYLYDNNKDSYNGSFGGDLEIEIVNKISPIEDDYIHSDYQPVLETFTL